MKDPKPEGNECETPTVQWGAEASLLERCSLREMKGGAVHNSSGGWSTLGWEKERFLRKGELTFILLFGKVPLARALTG